MSILIIAGGGKFGKKALDYGRKNKYKIILIDNNPNCFCAEYATQRTDDINTFYSKMEIIKTGQVLLLIHDISIIYELIVRFNPEYVIPVIPIHLLAQIIKKFMHEKTQINLASDKDPTNKFINSISKELLLTHHSEKGVAYLSWAKIDEICPDDCFGPKDFCPNFKRNKPITITDYFKAHYNLRNNFSIVKNGTSRIFIILESYQLTSGLGGLKGEDLKIILDKLNENLDLISSQNFSLIIATTCNCHGVVNFYRNFTN
ncbi:MAG: hypothetical protein ACFFDK_02580 [Promethearchaeota archaeon]